MFAKLNNNIILRFNFIDFFYWYGGNVFHIVIVLIVLRLIYKFKSHAIIITIFVVVTR